MTGGPSISAEYSLKITGYLPSGESKSFTLIIGINPCTPIIPTLQDQTYFINFPTGSYDAPAFTLAANCLSWTISYTNTVTTNNFISNNAGVGKLVSWQTNDALNIKQYTVTIAASTLCKSASGSYILDVRSACEV